MTSTEAKEPGPRRPPVGVAALVVWDGKILLAERLSGKLKGMYTAPGGHLEWMETFGAAAVRELFEETGIVAEPQHCNVVGVDQGFAPEEDHCWVIVFVHVFAWCGRPLQKEPEKHGLWGWYAPDELPVTTGPLQRFLATRPLPGLR